MREDGAKKGKYGITVPKPFAFDLREKTRPKTIRERKNELAEERKRIEDEAARKKGFRCKPIPAEVLQPRYNQIMSANEDRRLRVK